MGAPIVVPFNFDPIAVSVKTASYTIPAGRYAQVYVECENGGIFTINAVNAVVTANLVNIDVSTSNATASYTVPANYRAKVCGVASYTTTYSINGNVSASGINNTYSQVFDIGPAGTISVIFSAIGNTHGVQGVAIPGNATNRQATFWLPAGTVISGTGTWRATVMEFNKIS